MRITCTLIAILFLGSVAPLKAQQENGVSSVLEAYRITVDEDGEEISVPTTEVTPGDLIEYRLTYSNILDESVTSLYATLPIPIGMEFVLDSASPNPEGASLSNTGSAFQQLPLTRQVRQPDGTTIEEEVPGREYRRLRWLVPSLEAGDQVILVARVKVIEN